MYAVATKCSRLGYTGLFMDECNRFIIFPLGRIPGLHVTVLTSVLMLMVVVVVMLLLPAPLGNPLPYSVNTLLDQTKSA